MLKAIIFDIDDTLLDWEPHEQDWFDYDREHLGIVYDYINALHPLPSCETFVELAQANTVERWTTGGQTLEAPNLGTVLVEGLLAVPTVSAWLQENMIRLLGPLLIVIGAIAAVLMMFWALVLYPLGASTKQRAARIAGKQADLEWMLSAAASTIVSSRQPSAAPSSTMRARRTSSGQRASRRPVSVTRRSRSSAPSSNSNWSSPRLPENMAPTGRPPSVHASGTLIEAAPDTFIGAVKAATVMIRSYRIS